MQSLTWLIFSAFVSSDDELSGRGNGHLGQIAKRMRLSVRKEWSVNPACWLVSYPCTITAGNEKTPIKLPLCCRVYNMSQRSSRWPLCSQRKSDSKTREQKPESPGVCFAPKWNLYSESLWLGSSISLAFKTVNCHLKWTGCLDLTTNSR